eukprot:6231007-Amphidinium_carterae.1
MAAWQHGGEKRRQVISEALPDLVEGQITELHNDNRIRWRLWIAQHVSEGTKLGYNWLKQDEIVAVPHQIAGRGTIACAAAAAPWQKLWNEGVQSAEAMTRDTGWVPPIWAIKQALEHSNPRKAPGYDAWLPWRDMPQL